MTSTVNASQNGIAFSDAVLATQLIGPLNLTALAAKLTALRQQMLVRPQITGNTLSALSSLIAALNAAISEAEADQSAAEAVLGASVDVGNVVPGGDPALMAANFIGFAAVAAQDSDLTDMLNYLDRVSENITLSVS